MYIYISIEILTKSNVIFCISSLIAISIIQKNINNFEKFKTTNIEWLVYGCLILKNFEKIF
jgi:hypothetical protein